MPLIPIIERLPARILLVEDDPTVRLLVRGFLERIGLTVDEARNGSEALRLLTEHRYPLVLLDLLLPQVSGFEIIEFLRDSGGETNVIIMTAVTEDDLDHLPKGPKFDVIRKPFALSELQTLVCRILKTSSPEPARMASKLPKYPPPQSDEVTT